MDPDPHLKSSWIRIRIEKNCRIRKKMNADPQPCLGGLIDWVLFLQVSAVDDLIDAMALEAEEEGEGGGRAWLVSPEE